jgi:methylglutaconyl-CoA hydratase
MAPCIGALNEEISPMSKHIQVSVQQQIARITLNRPEVRNAFNDDLIAQLHQAFVDVGQRSDVRVVVLAAEGPAFCAGGDLNWMRAAADHTHEENLRDAGKLAQMLQAVANCPKPTIARIQGDVYAGGMGLVAACDMAVSVDSAQFCLSEVKIGLIPATISPYVIRAMGARAAQRYFLTAERFSAQEALRTGFVHEVVRPENLDAAVDSLTRHLCSASPAALKACKQLVHDVAGRDINAELIAQTVQSIADIRASSEGKEGVQAFLQKRKPSWLQS